MKYWAPRYNANICLYFTYSIELLPNLSLYDSDKLGDWFEL